MASVDLLEYEYRRLSKYHGEHLTLRHEAGLPTDGRQCQVAKLDRTALDHEIARLPPGRHHFQPALPRELAELRDRAVLASQEHHFYHQAPGLAVRAHALEHHHAAVRTRC